jgi:hypothetical protein
LPVPNYCALEFWNRKKEYALSRCSEQLPRANPRLEETKPGACFMFTETNQSHSELHQSLGKTQYLPGIMYMRLRTLNRELEELEEFLVTRRQTEKYQMVQLKEALVKRIEKYFKQLDDSNAGVFRQVEDDLRSMRLTLAEMESDLTKFS